MVIAAQQNLTTLTKRFSNVTTIDANGTSSQPSSDPMSAGPTSLPTRIPSKSPMPIDQELSPTSPPMQATTISPTTQGTVVLDGMQGAIVTNDCKFQDNSYAIDIIGRVVVNVSMKHFDCIPSSDIATIIIQYSMLS